MENINKKDIFIAILAGGKGERLWPKTRLRLPKQNLRLFGKGSIIQDVIQRAEKISPGNILIIASKENFFYIKKGLKYSKSKRIVVEPFGRNTAPAVGLAALLAFRKNNNSVLIAMPSDHIVVNSDKFRRAIDTAVAEASKKKVLITLGIKPTSAQTGYGYIRIDKRFSQASQRTSYKVTKFIEKPNPATARKLILEGKSFWNSGIFVFKSSVVLSMLKRHMPVLYKGLTKLPDIKKRHRFKAGLKSLYKKLKSESLDYAVVEKNENIRVVPSDFGWADIGSFNSIAHLAKKDRDGNAIFGSHIGIDTETSIILSEPGHLVGTIGVKDLVVCVTPDAVLVCDRKRAEDVKKLVGKIKKKKQFLKFL